MASAASSSRSATFKPQFLGFFVVKSREALLIERGNARSRASFDCAGSTSVRRRPSLVWIRWRFAQLFEEVRVREARIAESSEELLRHEEGACSDGHRATALGERGVIVGTRSDGETRRLESIDTLGTGDCDEG